MKRVFAAVTRISLRFKWVTVAIAVIALGAGIWAATQMNQELLPNIDFPQSFVFALQPGASSEDLRDLVTIPLENELVKIKGVVPAGLQTTTTAPVAVFVIVNDVGANRTVLQGDIQAAIDRVSAAGVPQGLKTTADLTPDIITRVLTKAPSMWKHFESRHILAMAPEVLDAALKVDPKFVDSLDPLTRDQIAAERVDASANGTVTARTPVALPDGWIMTNDKKPKIRTFNLSSLPVITASVTSDKLTPDQLRMLVNKEVVPQIGSVEGVAGGGVSVSGGQQIPQEVVDAAVAAVARQDDAAKKPADTSGQAVTPAPTAVPAAQAASATAQPTAQPTAAPAVDANGVPLVPASWRGLLVAPLINNLLRTPVSSAADFLNATDANGAKLTAAQAFNLLSDKNASLLRELPPAIVLYLKDQEPDFFANLNAKAQSALSADSFAALKGETPAPVLPTAWTTLANRPGYKGALLATVRDLLPLKGGAAGTINTIVANTPSAFASFSIRIVSSLTPDAVAYLLKYEPDFLNKLDPVALRLMTSETLKSLPAEFIGGLKDDALKKDLQAIIADPSKEAAAQLKQSGSAATVPDDPNAPKLPDTWSSQLKPFGINVTKADDLLRKPAGQPNAAAFLNLLATRGGANFMAPLSADVLLYVQSKDPTFFNNLDATTIGYFSKETLARLPREVSDRAVIGVSFTPTTTITRTNGESSLILSINKDSTANTVNVATGIEKVFAEIKAKNPDIQINTIFEQKSFITESISGVAREGGLGAIMAVLVILIFLHFSFRSTLVTAISIPTSIGIAFLFFYLIPRTMHPLIANSSMPETLQAFLLRLFPESITLNIMTLSGLTVAIGRVVDDSIVVLENIYRQLQKGEKSVDVVLRGTRDVSLAIFAATVTTVVVFLPIGLSGGIIGEFFLPFGLAVTYALAGSFVVAVTIVPVCAFLFIKEVHEEKEGRLERIYQRTIRWSLGHRFAVLGLALISLVIGMGLFATRPTTFLPAFGEPQLSVTVNLPSNSTIAQTDVRVRQFEDYVKTELIDRKLALKYQVTIGSAGGLASFVGGSGVSGNAAQISIAPAVSGPELTNLTAQVRSKAEAIFLSPNNVKVSKATLTDQGFGGFALVASGPEDLLKANDAQIIKTLSTVKGLTNVSSTYSQTAAAGATSTYLRINQIPAVQYSAELETSDTLGLTSAAIAAVKADRNLPADITVGEGYQSQMQTQGFSQTFGSLGLAILIVYIVMVITFGSLIHPLTILFSLPLAVVGAALGLTVTNRVVGISALIGLLMLVGIVVTNAIVLIDRVQSNRKQLHLNAHDALVEAGRTRLRPILMTAIATMIALVPLALGLSQGAIIAAELGTVVIGGLFSSTILTLVVVPVVYSLLDSAQRAVLRRPEPARAASAAIEEKESAASD